MNITLIGIDVAKDVFEVRYENHAGRKVDGGKVARDKLIAHITRRAAGCKIAMEACGSAHYWANEFKKLGFQVVMIAPQFVKSYRQGQKNDKNDAEAICIAARQPRMREVPRKSEEQLSIQAMHRVRERLKAECTALMNQTRGLMAEHGVVIRKGVSHFRKELPNIISSGACQSIARLLQLQWSHYLHLEQQINEITQAIEAVFESNEACQQIAKEKGVGPMIGTALVAHMGSPANFKNGRAFAAFLGITPAQHSTGGKSKLVGITKSGSNYIRQLIIHGARSVVHAAMRRKHHNATSLWVRRLVTERGKNRAAVAMANKIARHVWAILAGKTPFKQAPLAQAA